MKRLKYGFYGEDDAQKIFLHNYLGYFSDSTVFERDDEFCGKFRASNKRQVDTKFAYVAREGFARFQHDVFFVGRDIDSHQPDQFSQRLEHFKKERIPNLLVMPPVQCIEYWLLYLKYRVDNPASTKNVSFENQPRKRVKFDVYGNEEPPNEVSNPIVDSLSKGFAIGWLESRSESFRHFHKQVTAFLEQDKTSSL